LPSGTCQQRIMRYRQRPFRQKGPTGLASNACPGRTAWPAGIRP
jgi:hypothetical protein